MSERFPGPSNSAPEQPAEENKTPLEKVVFVETSDIAEEEARAAAEKSLTAERESLRGIKGFVKRIWKHNLFQEYYRQKEIAGGRSRIAETGNIYIAETEDKRAHDTALAAITSRFASEYKEAVHTESGEERRVLENTPSAEETRLAINELIRAYAAGGMADEAFEEEKNRIFSEITGADLETVRAGVSYADNLKEIAENVRHAVEHGKSLDELDLDFEVVVGRAKSSLHTEAHFSTVDRIVDKLKSTKVGRFVNETTLASSVALAYSLGKAASIRVAQSKALAWGTFGATGLISGAVAGMEESRKLELERRQHAREMARGAELIRPGESPRREEMEKFRHQTEEAAVLADLLQENLGGEDSRSAVAHLAEIESRLTLSERHKIDLVSYSSFEKVDAERLRLDMIRARAKVELRQKMGEAEFERLLEEAREARSGELLRGSEGVEARDRLFKKMKRGRVARAAAKGLATGLVIGGAIQEVGAFFTEGQEGALEHVVRDIRGEGLRTQGELHLTALESLRERLTGGDARMAFGNIENIQIGDAMVRMPEGVTLEPQGDGSFALIHGDERIAEQLNFNDDGALTEESRKLLEEQGIRVGEEEISRTIQTEERVAVRELIDQRPEDFQNVHRVLWYDNDTPAPTFDKNELKLWWGGKNGIDANGNYVFSVRQMTSDGSYHDGLSADAKEFIKEGKLKLLLSLSRDTQAQVIEVPIHPDGTAVIDPASETGKLLFGEESGKANFLGKYVEVAEVASAQNGTEQVRILATHVGEGLKDTMVAKEAMENAIASVLDLPANTTTDLPPIIPLLGRRPLEPTKYKKFVYGAPLYYGYYGNADMTGPEFFKKRLLKEIARNPNLDVVTHESELIEKYLERQKPEYRGELEALVEGAPAMRPETKVVIAIPAYQEGKNLERTLEQYAGMQRKEVCEIVIFENHPKGKERDNSGEIIARMAEKYPNMHVVHLYKEFEKKPAIGMTRKYLNDAVLLRKQQAGIDHPITIVSNDADLYGISERYVEHIERTFDENPKLDAIAGKWDYPKETFKKMPLLHAVQRLSHYFDTVFRYYYQNPARLLGANSAFRAGTYAAIGGYNEEAYVGEDLDVGTAILTARRYQADRIGYQNSAWIKTSPRRAVEQLMAHDRLIHQHKDFHENESVRKISLEEVLEKKIDFNRDEFVKEVTAIYNLYNSKFPRSKGGWVEDEYFDKTFKRAMQFLGVRYEKAGDSITITDTSKLESGLAKHEEGA